MESTSTKKVCLFSKLLQIELEKQKCCSRAQFYHYLAMFLAQLETLVINMVSVVAMQFLSGPILHETKCQSTTVLEDITSQMNSFSCVLVSFSSVKFVWIAFILLVKSLVHLND